MTERDMSETQLSRSIVQAFPVQGTELRRVSTYKKSLLGETQKLIVILPDHTETAYFLKVITMGSVSRSMCEGEYESLKALYAVKPDFTTRPIAWGSCGEYGVDAHFLLADFRDLGRQPAGPRTLATDLADLHQRSRSPTDRFGFHVKTCHGPIVQDVDHWDDCWATFFRRHLYHYMHLAGSKMKGWPMYEALCGLTLDKVVPRLLLPLQGNGRTIKPSLVHGDCWDGNTAEDPIHGRAFIFDACSFYGHNEYDIGNWLAPRHKLSDAAYIEQYKEHFLVSEPAEEWSSRVRLYSLPFNIGNVINIPDSVQQKVIISDMSSLCEQYCLEDLNEVLLRASQNPHLEAAGG